MRQTWKKQHSRLARSYTPKPTDVRASRLLPGENPLTSLKQSTPSADLPPRIDGKFLAVGSNRFHVKGVAYGTFAPNAHEEQYPPPAQIAHDVRSMVSAGFNTIRTYTAPSAALLDAAEDIVNEAGPRVMADLERESSKRRFLKGRSKGGKPGKPGKKKRRRKG